MSSRLVSFALAREEGATRVSRGGINKNNYGIRARARVGYRSAPKSKSDKEPNKCRRGPVALTGGDKPRGRRMIRETTRALDERRCGMRRPRALMIPEAGPTGDPDDI